MIWIHTFYMKGFDMKVNAYILHDYLSVPVLDKTLISDKNTCAIDEIAFFYEEIVPAPNQVIILRPPQIKMLSAMPGACLCIGKPDTKPDISCDVIYLDDCCKTIQVFEDLQRIFRVFHSWEMQLNTLVISKAPLQEFGDCSLCFLTNPITLYSASHRNIFASEKVPQGGIALFRPYDINAYLSDDELDEMRIDPEFAESIQKTEPSIFSEHIWGYRILFQNIRLSDIFVARLMTLETTRPIKDSDFPLIKILSDYIGLALQQTDLILNGHPKDLDNIIHRLLNREALPELLLSDTLSQVHWHSGDSFFCAAISINERDRATHTLSSECAHLERNLPGSIAVLLKKNILLICNLTIGQTTRENILSKLAYILRESLLKAGISMIFHQLSQLADYYEQADSALKTGNERNPTYWCHQYEDHALTILLQKARDQAAPDTLIPPGLRALIHYDLQNNRKYTHSLRVYLENDRNIAETCRLLYLHRATFLYHLKRIREITNYNLEDSHLRLYLRVIFEILEQEEALPF